jgi:hypothetical protein
MFIYVKKFIWEQPNSANLDMNWQICKALLYFKTLQKKKTWYEIQFCMKMGALLNFTLSFILKLSLFACAHNKVEV